MRGRAPPADGARFSNPSPSAPPSALTPVAVQLRLVVAGARRAIPRRIHGVRLARSGSGWRAESGIRCPDSGLAFVLRTSRNGHRRWPRSAKGAGLRTAKGTLVSDNPNILIIWGDDIGISNLSCYTDGVMGYRTRNIDRVASEGVRFTDYYGEQSCTAGRSVHHRPKPVPHRPHEGGHARRHAGAATAGPDHRHGAEGPGLCHRPVRQEPPG